MTPPESPRLISRKERVPYAFNEVAASYDLATRLSQGYQCDLDHSASLVEFRDGERVLDLCCGTGKSTSACLKHLHGGSILGIDNSSGMLEVAERKFSKEIEDGRVAFLRRDAMRTGLEPASFDVVFTAYGLRNMPDYRKFLEGVHGLLLPGGRLCIHDFSLVNKAWARWYWSILGYGFIVPFCTVISGSSGIYRYLVRSVNDFLTPGEIEVLLEESGFSDIRIHRHASWRRPILHTFTAVKP